MGGIGISGSFNKSDYGGPSSFVITIDANRVGSSTSLITVDANRASLSSFINIIKSVRTIGFSLPLSPVSLRRRSAVF